MKQCTECKEFKPYEEFHKSKQKKDGLYPICKSCSHEKAVKRYWKNPEGEREKRRKYVQEHKKEIKERLKNSDRPKQYYLEHKSEYEARRKKYNEENQEHIKQQTKEYRQRTKAYQTAKTRKRQALVLQRIPKCANLQNIEKFYEEARRLTLETGIKHEVDHIIPLQAKNVSGFHVEWNLQILTKSENARKRNNF